MRPSKGGHGGLERDVEDRLTQMRLRLLEEKLRAEKLTGGAPGGRGRRRAVDEDSDVVEGAEGGGGGEPEAELEAARRRRAELRELLERERLLAERLANGRPPSGGHVTLAGAGERRSQSRHDDGRGGDRFSSMMEMMMMQNSQMHNLMLGQMMSKQQQPQEAARLQSQQQQQPPPPPPPVFLPAPDYETYTQQYFGVQSQQQQQHTQQQRQVPPRHEPKEREPTPKPTTPVQKQAQKETAPSEEDEEDQKPFPFPGNKSQQKLRRLAYTAFFLASLNRLTSENKFRPRFDFLFDVRLKEMLETLHRIYKTPEGHLYSVTFATVMGDEAMELTELMNVPKTLSKDEERVVTQELAYCIENTVFQVTDIMPTKGIIGTHRKSGIFELIRSGNRFPKGYFYDMEKEMMEFDEEGRTDSVSDCDARMLIIGLFLMRALVETLYLKTEHYGMVVETTPKAERNIRLVASILTFIYRKVVGQLTVMDRGTKKARVSIPDLPAELSGALYTDQEIRPVLKLMKKSLDYAHNLLMHWSEEYVKRLRDAGFT